MIKLGETHVNLEDDIEDWIRTRAKRKGDLSKIVNSLLREAIFGGEKNE